jgi:hypothetical protein
MVGRGYSSEKFAWHLNRYLDEMAAQICNDPISNSQACGNTGRFDAE